jgi:hypothetical protein
VIVMMFFQVNGVFFFFVMTKSIEGLGSRLGGFHLFWANVSFCFGIFCLSLFLTLFPDVYEVIMQLAGRRACLVSSSNL